MEMSEEEYLKAKASVKEYERINNIDGIILPSKRDIETILHKWAEDHSHTCDFDGDRDCVKKAIKRYFKKLLKINA